MNITGWNDKKSVSYSSYFKGTSSNRDLQRIHSISTYVHILEYEYTTHNLETKDTRTSIINFQDKMLCSFYIFIEQQNLVMMFLFFNSKVEKD